MAYSLEGFAEMLFKAVVLLPAAEREAMEKAAVLLETTAKGIIGTPALVANAPATIALKNGVNSQTGTKPTSARTMKS